MKVTVAACFLAGAAATTHKANPIRRVVSLLQGLADKVEKEGKAAEKAYNKLVCYCEGNTKELEATIQEEGETIERLTSEIEETKSAKTQLDADLKQHKEDREAAKEAIAKGDEMREKEAADFASESGDMKANLAAMDQAIPAIEKGMAGSFLQTGKAAAATLVRVAQVADISDAQKQAVIGFLQGESAYEPASGQIVGILKQMRDEMSENLAEITKDENEAVASHNGMVQAKNKEIQASTEAIEEKTARSGDLAVEAVNKKGDLDETKKTKEADEKFLAELEAKCKTAGADHEEAKKSRAEEAVAIADTIKMLNSDDALELFKKTLPSTSLLQIQTTDRAVRAKAIAALKTHKGTATNLVLLALRGKKQGFEKVLEMVDKMIASLKQEQADDDEKIEFCKAELDKTEDQKKALQQQLGTLSSRISDAEGDIKQLKEEIDELRKGITDLDKSVADATEARKEEHEAYVDEAANNNAALQLLGMAKNRLNKFYHPKDYKEAPKEEKSEEEQMEEAYSFVQIRDDPPEVVKHEKSDTGGVIGLMDMLIQDLKKEMQTAEFEEKQAQEDYEQLMADSKSKRATDVAAVQEKTATLAESEGELQDLKGQQRDRYNEFMSNSEYLTQVHHDCDSAMSDYDARKEARNEELEGLSKAKDIVNGADFSLIQTSAVVKPHAAMLTKAQETSCSASDEEHRRMIASKFALLQGFCEDMCKVVGKHPDCGVCDGFVPPDATPGVQTWDELYAQFDKLKLVGRDMIKEWTGDAGKFGR